MNSEQVIEKILSQARQEAEKITAEAQAKLDEKNRQFASELAQYRRQTDELAKAAAEDKKARLLAAARMNVKKELLAAKVAVMDEIFDRAAGKLESLGDQQYRQFMTALMVKAVETGDEEVVIGKNEKRIDEELIKQVNRKLGPGFKGNIRLSPDRADIKGGFILRRDRIQTNVSLEVLLSQVREKMETALAGELFA